MSARQHAPGQLSADFSVRFESRVWSQSLGPSGGRCVTKPGEDFVVCKNPINHPDQYLVCACMPGEVTVGDSGLCCCVPCLLLSLIHI